MVQPATRNLVAQGIANGGNPLGLPLEDHQCKEHLPRRLTAMTRSLTGTGWTTLIDWQNTKDDDTVRTAAIAVTDKWEQLSKERGLFVDFWYMNDAGRDQNPLGSYGAQNIAKLKAISRKYDPAQVFQKLQNDGFLLRKV